jgi:hypothetical protein
MVSEQASGGSSARYWMLKLARGYTVPVAELWRGQPKLTVLCASDQGRAQSAAQVEEHLNKGARVLAVDPFYLGEARLGQRDYLWGLLISSVGSRPLGLQAGQLASVAGWAREERDLGPVHLSTRGARSSLAGLVACALAEGSVAGLETEGCLGSLAEVIERNLRVDEAPELFCFGLLEEFDITQLAALSAPRRVVFRSLEEASKKRLQALKAWYALWNATFDPFEG